MVVLAWVSQSLFAVRGEQSVKKIEFDFWAETRSVGNGCCFQEVQCLPGHIAWIADIVVTGNRVVDVRNDGQCGTPAAGVYKRGFGVWDRDPITF